MNTNQKTSIIVAKLGIFLRKMMPDRILSFKGEPGHGQQKVKQNLNVLLYCNADGLEKLSPLVIGRL